MADSEATSMGQEIPMTSSNMSTSIIPSPRRNNSSKEINNSTNISHQFTTTTASTTQTTTTQGLSTSLQSTNNINNNPKRSSGSILSRTTKSGSTNTMNGSPSLNPRTPKQLGIDPFARPRKLALSNGRKSPGKGFNTLFTNNNTTQTQNTSISQDGSISDSGENMSGYMSSGGTSGTHNTLKSKVCSVCDRTFSVFKPKHTCKVCTNKVCDDCSKNRIKLNRRMERSKGSRLCDPCARSYVQLRMLNQHGDPQMDGNIKVSTNGLAPPILKRRKSMPDILNERTEETRDSVSSNKMKRSPSSGGAIRTSGSSNYSERNSQVNESKVTMQGKEFTTFQELTKIEDVRTLINGWSEYLSLDNISKTFVSSEQSYDSHLRSRHWISLYIVGTLMTIRIFLVLNFPSSLPTLTWTLETLLSIPLLGAYVVALISFDELLLQYCKDATPTSTLTRTKSRRKVVLRRSTTSYHQLEMNEQKLRRVISKRESKIPETSVLQVKVDSSIEAPQEEGFNFDRFTEILDACNLNQQSGSAPGENFTIQQYLNACESVCGFIVVFGRATTFAASTVNGYIELINKNLSTWPSPPTSSMWSQQSIRAILLREVQLKTAATGGKKKPSCCRCMLRLIWFIEFVETFMRLTLVENQDEDCVTGACKAYETTLGAKHPWLVRKGVISALGSVPTRSTILASLQLQTLPNDELVRRIRHTQTQMHAIVTEVKALFHENSLDDIK